MGAKSLLTFADLVDVALLWEGEEDTCKGPTKGLHEKHIIYTATHTPVALGHEYFPVVVITCLLNSKTTK